MGRSGTLVPCSQFLRLARDKPNELANTSCVMPSLVRIALTSTFLGIVICSFSDPSVLTETSSFIELGGSLRTLALVPSNICSLPNTTRDQLSPSSPVNSHAADAANNASTSDVMASSIHPEDSSTFEFG